MGFEELGDDNPVVGDQLYNTAVPVTGSVVLWPEQIVSSAGAITVGTGLTTTTVESDSGQAPPLM